MNNNKKRNIVHTIEFIICLITVAAFFSAILSFVAMAEQMSFSYTSACIFIASLAWLVAVGFYTYIINR